MSEERRFYQLDKTGRKPIRRGINRLPIPERERIKRKFVEIGGNALFSDALVVFLGEQHTATNQRLIGEFIRAHAKKGDVVLVEGVDQYKKVGADSSKQEDYHFPQEVHVFGWDNIALNFLSQGVATSSYIILNAAKEKHASGDDEKALKILEILSKFRGQVGDIPIISRNPDLVNTLQTMKKVFPEKKVFIIAGIRHLTLDPSL